MKTVLGLFNNEDELRDALASDLTVIEEGLRLVDTNYTVLNPCGANGIFDILAKDDFGNFVIIEVKRSNQASRQALHELSKYISLFMEDQKVDQHKIRCFVVSTEWHELDIPLSYFKKNMPVDVEGYGVTAVNGKIAVSLRNLPPVDILPKLSPDMRFVFFLSEEDMRQYANELSQCLDNVQHVRLAMLTMMPLADAEIDFRILLCVWRVPELGLASVKDLIEDPELAEDFYYFKGWELETDVLNWIMTKSDKAQDVFAEHERATPEKVASLHSMYQYSELIRLGDWPKNDLVNDREEVLRCVTAYDVTSLNRRANRHGINLKSSKKNANNWSYCFSAFKYFIEYSDFWADRVSAFELSIPNNAVVKFEAWDERHFHFAVHKAVEYPEASLSQFIITVSEKGKPDICLCGGWAWDGITKPVNAEKDIEKAYGSVIYAKMMLFSAVDEERYENIYYENGFYPYVTTYNVGKGKPKVVWPVGAPKNISWKNGLDRYVSGNSQYSRDVSKCFADIPRKAGASNKQF